MSCLVSNLIEFSGGLASLICGFSLVDLTEVLVHLLLSVLLVSCPRASPRHDSAAELT